MRRWFGVLAVLLSLTGCVDAEMVLDFRSATEVEVAMDLTVGRELYDLTGGKAENFCKDGKVTVGAQTVSCVQRKGMTVDALVAQAQAPAGAGMEAQLRQSARVERLDDRRLRVTLDFAGMMRDAPQAAEARAMAGLMRAALAGHSLVFRIKAAEIEATTGTRSADGKAAEYVVPLTALISDPPAAFVTTLALKKCRLWVFC